MRYYLYVSDTKVDMLLAQVPSRYKRQTATELKLDLKVLGATHKFETAALDNRFARLQVVERYLRDHEMIGTVEQPASFVGGKMNMSWAPFSTYIKNSETPRNPEGRVQFEGGVYFGGVERRISVGLCGSMEHVIGSKLAASTGNPNQLGGTVGLLHSLVELGMKPRIYKGLIDGTIEEQKLDHRLITVASINRWLPGEVQALSFIAKPFWYGPLRSSKFPRRKPLWVLVGSPLFVALAE